MLFIIIVEFFCILIIKQPLPEIGNGCCVLKSNYYKMRRCGCVRQRQDGDLPHPQTRAVKKRVISLLNLR